MTIQKLLVPETLQNEFLKLAIDHRSGRLAALDRTLSTLTIFEVADNELKPKQVLKAATGVLLDWDDYRDSFVVANNEIDRLEFRTLSGMLLISLPYSLLSKATNIDSLLDRPYIVYFGSPFVVDRQGETVAVADFYGFSRFRKSCLQ